MGFLCCGCGHLRQRRVVGTLRGAGWLRALALCQASGLGQCRDGDEPDGQGSASGRCPALLPAAQHRKQPCRRERERKNPLRDLQGTNGAKNKP